MGCGWIVGVGVAVLLYFFESAPMRFLIVGAKNVAPSISISYMVPSPLHGPSHGSSTLHGLFTWSVYMVPLHSIT
ncbi:hypothetical protein GGR58DRAFT_340183 [Xylaria digitata]|nr:hypothetical protein GGR58DRAFT_340183 [Xylaria digitata]